MFFNNTRCVFILAVSTWLPGFVMPAYANHCLGEYQNMTHQLDTVGAQMKSSLESGDIKSACASARTVVQLETRLLGVIHRPGCVHKGSPSPSWSFRATADEVCALASKQQQTKANPPAATAKPGVASMESPSAPEASKESPATNAAAAPKAPATKTTGTQATSCSDITGLKGPRVELDCNKVAQRIRCAQGGRCLTNAKWNLAEPYNHGAPAVVFQPFRGPTITINMGETLWSVPDAASPTGRHLEARPWDTKTSFQPIQYKCAKEETDATLQAFVVRMECELQRQQMQETEFNMREESYPYMDMSGCQSPSSVRMNTGWEKRPLAYWKAHPQEPVGWCDIPARDNRTDTRPLREPKWRSVKGCEDARDILGTTVKIQASPRGVLGCKE